MAEHDHLLVVDYDFFFPNPMESGDGDDASRGLYDWGHAESPFFLGDVIWSVRAGAFLAHNVPLPQIQPPAGGWAAFWDRFTFADGTVLKYADSNVHAGEFEPPHGRRDFGSVHLFDAHHDSGYRATSFGEFLDTQRYSCEDWMLYQQAKGCFDLTAHYPAWKPNGVKEKLPRGSVTKQVIDDGQSVDTVFTQVFLCRSGAWVPPWCDTGFLDLLAACPLPTEQIDDEPMDRQFTLDQAHGIADQIRQSRSDTRLRQDRNSA